MNLPLFIARRIYGTEDARRQVSRPAIRIATLGVAIGVAVMIVTVCVVLGFKHTIRDKVVGFGSHIQIQNFMSQQTASPAPISISDSLLNQLRQMPGVRHVECYALTQGILKTDNDFLGVGFKGIGSDYDLTFLKKHLVEGEMPVFSSDKSNNHLLISRMMADKLRLKAGDRIYAYFIAEDNVRARKFTIKGIYVKDVNRKTDRYGEIITSQTIYEAYPHVFQWLSLLDINVWIIFALMVAVAGFTMVSGLLIIILERTQMIGILKALGMRNSTVRHTFLWFAVFIIGRGLILGNIIGLGLVLLQQYTGIIHLDPASYYVDTAPMELNIPIILLLNVATLLICVFVLIAPSYLVSHIHPARSMRYE